MSPARRTAGISARRSRFLLRDGGGFRMPIDFGARTAFPASTEMPRQLVKLTSLGQFHAFPISLHFAHGTCKEVSCAWASGVTKV